MPFLNVIVNKNVTLYFPKTSCFVRLDIHIFIIEALASIEWVGVYIYSFPT